MRSKNEIDLYLNALQFNVLNTNDLKFNKNVFD